MTLTACPEPLCRKEWTALRIKAGEKEPVKEMVPVEWPGLTRVVHSQGDRHVMKSIFPRGNMKLGPDGAVWVSAFSGEGHINPANGQYSPYYSAELFRSDDMGKTFSRVAHMEYPADGDRYPYLSGGFSDSDFEWMPDGSMVWFFPLQLVCEHRRGMVADVLEPVGRHGQELEPTRKIL